jgi:5-methylcytosine-specific restriction endonuclease McrA
MQAQVLVLDQGYQPINTVPWTKAMLYIAKDKVDVLEEYDYDVHCNVGMPAVVRIRHKIATHKQRIKFSRQNVLARDRFRCQYCGAGGSHTTLTFDHVVPRSKGGKTAWGNIVMACQSCNATKADRTPREAGMRLRTRPARPTWVPVFNFALRDHRQIPAEWREYWTAELLP